MFDIGGIEILVVAIVAILVVGPKDLPALLRTIGRLIKQAKKMMSEVQDQFQDALRQSELDEIRKLDDEVKAIKTAVEQQKTSQSVKPE